MTITCNQAKKIFTKALHIFLERESAQIMSDINERNLCGRLALYLQEVANSEGLSKYYADPEYNRMQDGKIKTILDERFEVVTINCDLILHSRGEIFPGDNLIAIEMKKSGGSRHNEDMDRKRLRALTKESFDGVWSADGQVHPEHVCGYKLGVFVVLDRKACVCRLEYYGQGARFLDEEIVFSEARQ